MNANSQDPDRPTTREDAIELLEPLCGEEWQNYGDVNPGPHGGMWVKYDPEYQEFDCVVTFQAADVISEVGTEDTGDQYVWTASVDWHDLIDDDGSLTDWLDGKMGSLLGHTPDVMAIWADGTDPGFYAVEMAREIGRGRRAQMDDYDAVIESFGVERPQDAE